MTLQHVMFTQYNMNQGIKQFGDAGKEAVMTEMRQLHDRKVIKPAKKKDLTPRERYRALGHLMFLKRKRCVKIKGRRCADGRPQRDYMSKQDTASPTVSTEALLLSCVIDAVEN